ncbi:MAG: alpha-mannosidase [Cellulomonas sp. 73-145]|uniref:alpha-mannosidase n=1 Tax=Cellulomonas sp. 73-145 TaxID=1895739 RepID=UPI00092891EC|nr:glycoside hydrolase family 38 C-terminal domain-containing protein [Cellulomonas sp. 73-145]OJV59627.1 MAG: alpha-mannosidase [Cellulomonas sp. 73-145]
MHRAVQSLTMRIERILLERLVPAVYGDREPVEVAALHLPGEPVPAAEALGAQYEPFAVGDRWGPPWSTTWFRFRGQVPDRMRGRRVELLVDLGFERSGPGFRSEGLAYTPDGRPLKGIEPRTAYVPVARDAEGGEPVDVYVEAAANPRFTGVVTALGDPRTAPREPLYRLDQAELAVLEEDVWHLVLDLQVLHQLAETLPESSPRRQEIRTALEAALDELALRDVVATAPAARDRLRGVLAAKATASAHRVSATGHAHIDSAWLWPTRETVRKCSRTFSNVVALADEYPDLVFACSSAQQYAWMEQHHPAVFEGIRAKVAAGQFVPVGGMWVESDTNLPGGESLVRQFTYGKRYFAERFGVEPQEVWLPDSFGYTGALPQLARLAGFRWFLSQKMSWNDTNVFPHHTFWWEGIDGTRVFTHFPPADTYSAELTGGELARGVARLAEHDRATRSLLPFGYGDGGGGPTREMLEVAHRVADLEGSPRVVVESPRAFFEGAEQELPDAPVWSGEMYLEFHRGTYTSQAAMKEGNRRLEHLLREAELWSATAASRGRLDYPYDELDGIWREALLLQFHDILPGSSIAWVHQQARETYAGLLSRTQALVDAAVLALAGTGDTELVFNAAPHARDGVPALAAGKAVAADAAPVALTADDGGTWLDNGELRVHVAADGTLDTVTDLRAGRQVLPAGSRANVLQLHPDLPNRFDAWDIDAFYRNRSRDLDAVDSLETRQHDDGSASVTVVRTIGASRFEQVTRLAPGERAVELRTDVDWQERESLLKVAFPVDVHADRSTSEVQFGHVHRATHTNTSWDAARFEIPAHRWLHVAEPGYGVALVNERTYGHDVTRRAPGDAHGAGATTVRLSLLRGPRYPDPETDRGRHSFGYRLLCGAGIPDAVREGYRANLAPRRVRGAGPVPAVVSVDTPQVVVEAVKLADDRSGDLVVRLYESCGGRTTVRVAFDRPGQVSVVDLLERHSAEVAGLTSATTSEQGVSLTLKPFQVVTLRVRR